MLELAQKQVNPQEIKARSARWSSVTMYDWTAVQRAIGEAILNSPTPAFSQRSAVLIKIKVSRILKKRSLASFFGLVSAAPEKSKFDYRLKGKVRYHD